MFFEDDDDNDLLFTERDLDCNQSYFNASEVREKEKHRDT